MFSVFYLFFSISFMKVGKPRFPLRPLPLSVFNKEWGRRGNLGFPTMDI